MSDKPDDVDPYGHPRIPLRGKFDEESCRLRREWAERFASCRLKHTGEWWRGDDYSSSILKGNIENPIGLASIPLGLAGPLLVHGEHVKGYVLLPFATTEGALVASATRGAAALTRSGGVRSRVVERTMVRAPTFILRSFDEAQQLWRWMQQRVPQLQEQVSVYSAYTRLLQLVPHYFGKTLVVEFKYSTGDAAGQNMVTTGTWNACKWLLERVATELPQVKVVQYFVETGLSRDKKSTVLNLHQTRGVSVMAEAWIPDSVITSTLKVDKDSLLACYRAIQQSHIMMGAIGMSSNTVNVMAGVFAATGQDLACVTESATGMLTMESLSKEEMMNQRPADIRVGDSEMEGGLYVSIVIPSLVVGTVGGGTNLPTQRECLQLLGCHGDGGVSRLAEIIVGYCLSLEVSTISSIASGTFASAHEKLGKNRPTNGFKEKHLDHQFFSSIVGDRGKLLSWKAFTLDTGNSILSGLTANELSKKVGHFGYTVNYESSTGNHSVDVVIKSKSTDVETCNMANKIAQQCGLTLASLHERYKMETGFRNCHVRELELAHLDEPVVRCLSPVVYHTLNNTATDVHVVVMEYLSSKNVVLLNTANDISPWRPQDIKVVLRDLAHLHSVFLHKQKWLHAQHWMGTCTTENMHKLQPLWRALLDHAGLEFPQFWTKSRVEMTSKAIDDVSHLWTILEQFPHTLIHNDCNPRNLCLRKPSSSTNMNTVMGDMSQGPQGHQSSDEVPFKDQRCLCMYDWELCSVGVPQRDVAEFLSFTLSPDTAHSDRLDFIEFYRQHLQYYSGMEFPANRFHSIYNIACLGFAMNRLLLYTMVHTFKDYSFLPRVVQSLFNYLAQEMSIGRLWPLATSDNQKSKL